MTGQLEKMLKQALQIVDAHFGEQSQATFLARCGSQLNIFCLGLPGHQRVDPINGFEECGSFSKSRSRNSTLSWNQPRRVLFDNHDAIGHVNCLLNVWVTIKMALMGRPPPVQRSTSWLRRRFCAQDVEGGERLIEAQ